VSAQVLIEAHLHRADIVEDLEESGQDNSGHVQDNSGHVQDNSGHVQDNSGHVQDNSSHVQEGISEKSKTQKCGKISLKDAIDNARDLIATPGIISQEPRVEDKKGKLSAKYISSTCHVDAY
jgi:uncharacterized protein YjbJ (UPF0337 family)